MNIEHTLITTWNQEEIIMVLNLNLWLDHLYMVHKN